MSGVMPEEKEKQPPHEELKKGLELLGPAAENMSEEQIRTLLSDFKKRRDDLAENMKYESIFLRLHYEKQQVEVVRGTRISKWDVTTTPATEVEVERNDIDCMGFSDEDTDPVKLQYDSYKEHGWFVVRTSRPFLALVVIDVNDQPAARIVVSGYGSERFEPRTDTVKVTVTALPFPSFFALEGHMKRMVELFPIVERNKIPGEVKELRFRCDEHDAKGAQLSTQLEECEGKLTDCAGKLTQLVQEIGCDRVNHVKLVDDFKESSRVQGTLTEETKTLTGRLGHCEKLIRANAEQLKQLIEETATMSERLANCEKMIATIRYELLAICIFIVLTLVVAVLAAFK